MESLETYLNYKFRNSLLLAEALTHPSLAYETQKPHFDNQRLEFLGDAVLQLVLTEQIFHQFPHYSEGQMTKLRSKLVSKEALHQFAKKLHLSNYILMGKGEKSVNGQHRASTLADAFEAILGAIYLDGGFNSVQQVVVHILENSIQEESKNPEDKNPKGLLQETLQAIIPESPVYEVINEIGPDHEKIFTVRILWLNHELAQGTGSSKKLAENNAAHIALREKKWKTFK